MFARRIFPARYFVPRYFPAGGHLKVPSGPILFAAVEVYAPGAAKVEAYLPSGGSGVVYTPGGEAQENYGAGAKEGEVYVPGGPGTT